MLILGRTREGRVHERDTDLYTSVSPRATGSCEQTANFTHEMGKKEERVMRIGMVGAGAQGGTLAKQLAKAGHEVRVANRRGPQSLQEFAKQTGTIASTVEDAATNAEVIMIALPFKDIPSLPKPLFKDLPDSVTIVDVSNYYPSWRDGPIPEVEADPEASELAQSHIGRPVARALNSSTSESLQ